MTMNYGSGSVLKQYEQYAKESTLAPPVAPMRDGSVAMEIRDLHAQLQALDDVTGELRQVLDSLMVDRPRPDNAIKESANPTDRCKVAGEIHAAVDLARNITAKCNDMICCLDI